MKKLIITLYSLALVFGVIEIVMATPITFDMAGAPSSSVIVTDSAPLANLTANLAGNLEAQTFTLDDGQSQTIDFFALTASGLFAFNQSYKIIATLAFDSPSISGSTGTGGGTFGTLAGVISGGTLTWGSIDPSTFVFNGNNISVDFEDGFRNGLGNTAMVHAYITNNGGGLTSVPEPGTMLTLGSVLLGLVAVSRKRFNQRN